MQYTKIYWVSRSLTDDFFSGLLTGNFDNVKLHITLMNSRYGVTEDDEEAKRKAFDASNILNEYSDFEFGETVVNNIHLSQIATKGPDGYYQPTTVVPVWDAILYLSFNSLTSKINYYKKSWKFILIL